MIFIFFLLHSECGELHGAITKAQFYNIDLYESNLLKGAP